jgi:hypothetical protein
MQSPIILPPLQHPAWNHAREIAAALRTHHKTNPFVIAALANAFAESWWTATAKGDHGQSFGPWQLKAQFYRAQILAGVRIDICDPATTLAQHTDAVLFALALPANAHTLAALDAATNGEEATRIWCRDFERASAAGAIERRVAIAPSLSVWLAHFEVAP